jgi:hypothetical protein
MPRSNTRGQRGYKIDLFEQMVSAFDPLLRHVSVFASQSIEPFLHSQLDLNKVVNVIHSYLKTIHAVTGSFLSNEFFPFIAFM